MKVKERENRTLHASRERHEVPRADRRPTQLPSLRMFDVSFSEDPSLPTRLSPMCSCTVHVAYTPPASFGRLSTSGTSSLKLMSGLKKKESVVRAGAGTAGRRTLCGVAWYSSLLKRWRICPT